MESYDSPGKNYLGQFLAQGHHQKWSLWLNLVMVRLFVCSLLLYHFPSLTYVYPDSDACTKFRTLYCHLNCQLWVFMHCYHAK